MALRTPGGHPPATNTSSAPPLLLHYVTWVADGGFHARYDQVLPPSALTYGCAQEIHALTGTELVQAAVRNRVKVWAWETQ